MILKVVIAALAWWCLAAAADQNDPRLDDLFQQLQQTQDLNQGDSVTEEIWKIWYETQDEQAKSLLDKGIGLMDQADFSSALIVLTELTELKPQFAEGWNRRATLFYLVGEFSLSIKDIEHTLELEPRHFGAIAGLGQIYMHQNKLIEARKAFEKALEINPHLVGARINILQIRRMLGETST